MVALDDAVDDVTLVVGHEQAHPDVQQQADHRDCDVVPVRSAKSDCPPGVRRGLHLLDIFEAFVAADLALGFGDILFQEALDAAIKVAGFAAVPAKQRERGGNKNGAYVCVCVCEREGRGPGGLCEDPSLRR